MKNGIYQSVVGPIYPGWTNEKFGKTSTEIWDYRAAKDLYAEVFLKLKEKYGKIQVIGFSYGGLMAILGYLSLKKEDREGIRVLVGDPGNVVKCFKKIAPITYWRNKFISVTTPRYDSSWSDFFMFPLGLPGRFIMWIYRKLLGSPMIDEVVHTHLYGEQLDEMLAKEEDGSLDIQVTGCGKKVSDMTDQDIIDLINLGDRYDIKLSEASAFGLSIVRWMYWWLSFLMNGFCTRDGYEEGYEEIAKKTKYPLTVFPCIHSAQMTNEKFWETLKQRMILDDPSPA